MIEKPINLILLNTFSITIFIIMTIIITLCMIDTFVSWDTSRIILLASMHGVIFILLFGIWICYKFIREIVEAKE